MKKIPDNFHILIIYDDQYDLDSIESQFIYQAGLPHGALIDLDDLLEDPEKKIGVVIYIDRSDELGEHLEYSKQGFKKLKRMLEEGIPALNVKILKGVKKSILKVKNFPHDNNLQRIINFLTDHLNKMYKFS